MEDHVHSAESSYSRDVCSGVRPYFCDICNKTFRQKVALIRHQIIHTGERPYTCNICNKAFSDPSNLIRHLRVHSGERLILAMCVIRHLVTEVV